MSEFGSGKLISPLGGKLCELTVSAEQAEQLKAQSRDWVDWALTPQQMCDLELLVNGAYSPLTGFASSKDVASIASDWTLADGTLCPVPIVLGIPATVGEKLSTGDRLALRDAEGVMLAAVQVSELWQAGPEHEPVGLAKDSDTVYVAGEVDGVRLPIHFDFPALRLRPREVREEFVRLGWRRVLSFQTERLIHRAEKEAAYRGALKSSANIFLHPSIPISRPGEIDYYAHIKCYRAIIPYFPHQSAKLALLPYNRRNLGTRELIWRGIIARNYGCSHLMIDSRQPDLVDSAPDTSAVNEQEFNQVWEKYGSKLEITPVPFEDLKYVDDLDDYKPSDQIGANSRVLSLSGPELKQRLDDGRDIPGWFTFSEVARELRQTFKPRYSQGFTVFFTGLSGAGKSTLANALRVKLMQMGGRPVTLLDGDIVRKNLSSELGFSREHRDINIRRIGFVASEITKNGGIAICAPIAPYQKVRGEVREMIEAYGGYVLVHVSTPLETCESRDRKGLYEKARAGIIKEFTGISDPYEEPEDADVKIDTSDLTPEQAVWEIIVHLEQEGYIGVGRARD